MLVTLTLVSTHISLFRTDGVRTSQQCVCICTAVYSQTLTAISIFKYVNIVCTIQVHTLCELCFLKVIGTAIADEGPIWRQQFSQFSLLENTIAPKMASSSWPGCRARSGLRRSSQHRRQRVQQKLSSCSLFRGPAHACGDASRVILSS